MTYMLTSPLAHHLHLLRLLHVRPLSSTLPSFLIPFLQLLGSTTPCRTLLSARQAFAHCWSSGGSLGSVDSSACTFHCSISPSRMRLS
jgi:hypothetical protein